MSFTKSTVSTSNISDLPTKPTIPAIELQKKHDQYGIDDVVFINNFIDELEAVTAGSDIGTNAPSITAANVTDALEENRLIVNGLSTAESQNVKITGNQTVAGVKTFSSSPIVPTPTTDTQATNKLYVDSQSPLTIPNDSIQNVKMATDVKIGSLATLLTTIKTSVTNAINEIFGYSLTPKQTGGGYFINGNFDVRRRSDSLTGITGDPYDWDRHVIDPVNSGGGVCNVSVTEIQDSLLPFSNYHRMQMTSPSTFSPNKQKRISLETLKKLAGKIITVSFWARTDIPAASFVLNTFLLGGLTGTIAVLGSVAYTLDSGWTKVVKQISIGTDIAGTESSYLMIQYIRNQGGDIGTGYMDTAGLKLEIGEVSTNFIPRPIAEELRDCDRYLLPVSAGEFRATQVTANIINFKAVDSTKLRTSVPTLIDNGVEGVDWEVRDLSGVGLAGFVLTINANHGIRATKTTHGLSDAYLKVFNTYKLLFDDEL